MRIIKDRTKAAHNRQKKYANIQIRPLKFDRVFLKVALWKHLSKFGIKGKLASKYIKPFKNVYRQKKYANIQIRPLKFDRVFLKVALWKHLSKFGIKGKLAFKYIKPFKNI